jgi:phosphatidylglycerophosphate synthase
MEAYRSESRRPIAGLFRRTAHATVRFCVRRNIHPDVISYASIVASAGAAFCFWRAADHFWLLLLAPALCYVRLWFNMLDGMVALASGRACGRGEIVNDVPDRISDVLIFAGVAHSGLAHPMSGYWAAILALFTAYVGTLGQAVGGRREFGGWMSKPWRMVLLHAGAWTTFFLGDSRIGSPTVLDWTCIVVIAGCLQTVVVRLSRTLSLLREKSRPSS